MVKIDVLKFQKEKALEFYAVTPKTMTAVTHANESDDSEFPCIARGINREGFVGGISEGWPYSIKRIFTIPRQSVELLQDPAYGKFYVVKVIPQFEIPNHSGKEFYLIAQTNGRSGFLVAPEALADSVYFPIEEEDAVT